MSLNCTLTSCETARWFGVAGTCVNNTCICPPDYNGNDDFEVFQNTCHIKLELAYHLHLAALIMACLSLSYSIYSFFRESPEIKRQVIRSSVWLACKDFCVSPNEETEIDNYLPSFRGDPEFGKKSEAQIAKEAKEILKVKMIFASIILTIITIGYQIVYLRKPNKRLFEKNVITNIFLAVWCMVFFFSQWSLVEWWYRSLPSPKQFSKINSSSVVSFVTKYPNFIHICNLLHLIIGWMAIGIIVVVLPEVSNLSLRQLHTYLFMYCAVEMLNWSVTLLWINRELKQVYKASLSSILTLLKENKPEEDEPTLQPELWQDALWKVNEITAFTLFFGGFGSVVLVMLCFWSLPLRQNMYVTVNVILICVHIAVISYTYAIADHKRKK